ncbi:MAG: FAD-dependent oxidoreductase [Acidobacteria bacterium RIFCSPLOWO2_02_FULL_65_29]|nr:MAG: FAD-dependent oxidoreductase [Acidobacteria bacterium RIFCSPLOWO2_02_FULL_65_29]
MAEPTTPPTVIVGAGPAGLTAAYLLLTRGRAVRVIERDRLVGGIAQTAAYKGFRFDIGGHRFFTKVTAVTDLWRAMLGPDFLRRPRLSRIYYGKKFFDYPLKPMNALFGLGFWNAFLIGLSYVWSHIHPIAPEVSFEDWVSNRFGRRLYRTFFKTYTEKVWGIPCHTITAQWAAQRIKGLSLWTAVTSMLFGRFMRKGKNRIKTLIDEFEYPRYGPGMMWEKFHAEVVRLGGRVDLETAVTAIVHEQKTITGVELTTAGRKERVPAAAVLSTMPLRHLVHALEPPAPPEVRAAADRLKYRDFITVALILNVADTFPDNWIYVHDEQVKLGRVQNFKNWSPEMVPDPKMSCLGLEYFCFEGDGLWTMKDADLIALGTREMAAIGLIDPSTVVDGTVVRMPKAYPVYDEGYEAALEIVKHYLLPFTNLQVAGRNGMHKYNNQDHSMVTAMLAVQNLCGERHDVWAVNAEDEYHEEAQLTTALPHDELRALRQTQPAVPRSARERL